MKKPFLKFAVVSAVVFASTLGFSGCYKVKSIEFGVETDCPLDASSIRDCTGKGTIKAVLEPKKNVAELTIADLSTVEDGSYTLSLSAPSSMFSASTSASSTTTISVTTDTGYTSSITLPLTSVSSAISPVNSGDEVFSFNISNTSTLDAWVQNIAANTTSSISLTNTANFLLQPIAAGSATVTAVVTSNATGPVNVGDATVILVNPSSNKCVSGSTNKACPVPVNPAE
jgi:hypothetical protein